MGEPVLKKSVKVAICAAIYIAAIAAMSVLFVLVGQNQTAAPAPDEFPAYTAAMASEPIYSSLAGWDSSEINGERLYTAPVGDVHFVVKRATAYQKELAAYAQANVRSVRAEETEFLSGLSVGEIGGRETYIFEYADFELQPAQYRKVYFFNIGKHTYGAMGAAGSREMLEQIDFDAIVANFDFE